MSIVLCSIFLWNESRGSRVSPKPLDQNIHQCLRLKADRNPCLIVNIKCRQAFPSSLFPVSHMTPAGRRGIQPGNNPWKTSSLTNLIHTSMSSLHVAALFARTAFTTVLPVHQNVEKKKLWSNYTWQAFQNDWGQRTRDRGGSKWAVTLNDAGILF